MPPAPPERVNGAHETDPTIVVVPPAPAAADPVAPAAFARPIGNLSTGYPLAPEPDEQRPTSCGPSGRYAQCRDRNHVAACGQGLDGTQQFESTVVMDTPFGKNGAYPSGKLESRSTSARSRTAAITPIVRWRRCANHQVRPKLRPRE